MKTTSTAIAALVALSALGAARQDGGFTGLLGAWSGTVTEGARTYRVEVTLDRSASGTPSGETRYVELNCRGSLVLQDASAAGYVFSEQIDSPAAACISGRVDLRLLDDGQLQYEWRRARPDAPLQAQGVLQRVRIDVTFDRMLNADREPGNWLTYSRTLSGQRYSPLAAVSRSNVHQLELAWLWQTGVAAGRFQATPLVVDGMMYTVRPVNDVVALDAATGQLKWTYSHTPIPRARASGGGGYPNRGLAILGGTLFLGTLDAHLLAIDAATGTLVWKATVADAADPACGAGPCYVITHAPLVVKDKVLVGVGGGEGRIRGFLAAFDAATGKEAWRFHTIPAPGEPGNDTWSGESWKTGGGAIWTTGAYDPDLNLTYWGTGNPSPNYQPETRLGDNLYTNSVVALDADSGSLRWHYQFTPHDDQDWDSAQTPVLTDVLWQGQPRKVMLWANRNGLVYVLDRTTGQFLAAKPFVDVNWMDGFDERGRPIRTGRVATPDAPLKPGTSPTNWQPASYSPGTGLLYVTAWESPNFGRGVPAKAKTFGAVRAFDPTTLTQTWEFRIDDAVFWRGVLTTGGDLLFTGTGLPDAYFYALDARTGDALWKFGLAGSIQSPPVTYAVGGRQYVAVAGGTTLFVFSLRQ
jgi:alcohol dehydrogenase (cytochrome c)